MGSRVSGGLEIMVRGSYLFGKSLKVLLEKYVPGIIAG